MPNNDGNNKQQIISLVSMIVFLILSGVYLLNDNLKSRSLFKISFGYDINQPTIKKENTTQKNAENNNDEYAKEDDIKDHSMDKIELEERREHDIDLPLGLLFGARSGISEHISNYATCPNSFEEIGQVGKNITNEGVIKKAEFQNNGDECILIAELQSTNKENTYLDNKYILLKTNSKELAFSWKCTTSLSHHKLEKLECKKV